MYNGPLLIECKTIRHVVLSAAKAETNAFFQNVKITVSLRHLLTELGHPQQKPIIINNDNSTAARFANKNMQMKKSKSWDMSLHWLRERELRKRLKVEWGKWKR